ncbi:MAG: magnesium transporter CorA family protein [Ilumatobacteraceae bacterium]
MGAITTRVYERDAAAEVSTGIDLEAVSDVLAGGCELVWIDMDDPDPPALRRLAEELGLHHLSVEDALDPHQRDKYVHYEHHVFLVCHAIDLDVEKAELVTAEIDTFIGDRWIVTVHRGRGDLMDRIVERWDRKRQMGGRSVGFILYGLLAVVSDGYFAAIDQFEEYYDDAGDRVFAERPIEPTEHRVWFEMRKALNAFDRIIRPLAEAVQTAVSQDLDRYDDAAEPYLRDAAGELARASTEVDSLRELVDHIVDANLVLRDYRQNLVMKKVTSWAAIIAVPTLVTGFYGMNVPYPGEGETWGVLASTAIALTFSGGLYALFKRKEWL